MPSSLFPQQSNSGNSILAALNAVKSLKNGNPQMIFNDMYQNNAQFREFADAMKGKSPEQAFSENGFDYNQVRNLL